MMSTYVDDFRKSGSIFASSNITMALPQHRFVLLILTLLLPWAMWWFSPSLSFLIYKSDMTISIMFNYND